MLCSVAGTMEPVTNRTTGTFRPVPTVSDSLIATRNSGEGFVPAAGDFPADRNVGFKHCGSSWYYLTWSRPAFFASGLTTDLDSDELRTGAAGIGGQIDKRFTILSRLAMTLSLGYAVAIAEARRDSDEFMVSLKVLR